MLTNRWRTEDPITDRAEQELAEYSPVLRQLLFNRGLSNGASAKRYLLAQTPTEARNLDPHGIEASVDRILHAVDHQERIVVFGDYDVDGVTASALLIQALTALGGQASAYIPNRFEEGYGLNSRALEHLRKNGTSLVIAVDCGIRSLAEAARAQELGLALIVVDHHHPGAELPAAAAIINPKQSSDPYPDKDLAGVGLAFKLAQALLSARHVDGIKPDDLADLVALGTVSDLVPLTGENRALVRRGLLQLRRARRQGVRSLIGVAGLNRTGLRSEDIGFVLGPRLNAAGRLETAEPALQLLLSNDLYECGRLAQQLDNYNRERQRITRQLEETAELRALARKPDPLVLYASDPEYHPGVVGLAASRLAKDHYRPAIVAHKGPELTRGSCRSIEEFHITEALEECRDLLERYGGHAAAAGFTVRNDREMELIERLDQIAYEKLAQLDLRPTLYADMELPLSALKPELIQDLEMLEPTGQGNRRARFISRNLAVRWPKAVGKDGSHLKMAVTDGRLTLDAIAFRQGHWIQRLGGAGDAEIDILYAFETNEYNNQVRLQLNVRDIRLSEGS